MILRCFSDPVIFVSDFQKCAKACRYHNGSREVGKMACIPLERSSKMIINHVEFVSIDELHAEILGSKGVQESRQEEPQFARDASP